MIDINEVMDGAALLKVQSVYTVHGHRPEACLYVVGISVMIRSAIVITALVASAVGLMMPSARAPVPAQLTSTCSPRMTANDEPPDSFNMDLLKCVQTSPCQRATCPPPHNMCAPTRADFPG